MRGVKFNFFVDLIIVSLVFAYAFFIVFQFDHEVAKVISLDAPEIGVQDETIIKVMTYNIAHGRGHLSMYEKSAFGRNFNIKSEEELTRRLDKIAELVRENNIDILVLEEVDFDASWSYNVDQAMYLANKAGFSNVVEGFKWSVDVPFLKIKAGNAILSNYPIMYASNTKFRSESFWRRFVGGHSFLDVTYLINGKPLRILATHLDSDSDVARVAEAEEMVEVVASSKYPVLIAGDLNTVTPLTKKVNEKMRNKFTDSTLETFINSGLFEFNEKLLRPNDDDMFTYSAEDPHRIIDFIFTTPEVEITEYYVVQEDLSDHYPLTARIIV